MKKYKKPTNRDIVLRVATDLFLTKGYLATSMDEIVVESKVSKTNIYYYFKSKDELLSAIVETLVQTYTGMIHDVISRKNLTVQERITTLLHLLTRQELECLGGCPFLTLYSQMPQDAHLLREKISRFFRDQVDLLEALLTEGIRSRQISAQLPARSTAQFIVSAVEGGLILQHVSQDPNVLENTLQFLAFLLK
ncbi:TetR/AcrR family transcriptional regulator [Paenibacillus elgii]|uniref:TetR/AcrR family transcriptional regulator n=2 Tax=Paenibacillus elgii TaxID=189691 RepID=A0A2T6G502_9BACL|nr:TetR/AcrR family transcriptional regulator [Paenibacillus elgii]